MLPRTVRRGRFSEPGDRLSLGGGWLGMQKSGEPSAGFDPDPAVGVEVEANPSLDGVSAQDFYGDRLPGYTSFVNGTDTNVFVFHGVSFPLQYRSRYSKASTSFFMASTALCSTVTDVRLPDTRRRAGKKLPSIHLWMVCWDHPVSFAIWGMVRYLFLVMSVPHGDKIGDRKRCSRGIRAPGGLLSGEGGTHRHSNAGRTSLRRDVWRTWVGRRIEPFRWLGGLWWRGKPPGARKIEPLPHGKT